MDKAVVKAFLLLETLAKSGRPLGVTELSKLCDMGKSNVHRLLQTLQNLQYVEKTGDNNYQASLRMWELGSQIISGLDLRDIARPWMYKLSDTTNEAVHLSILDRFEVLYVDKIESKEPVRAYTQLGGRAPAYCTATGKAMMAYLDPQQITKCFDTVTKYTPKTITDLDRFLVEAEKICERGFAVNRGEWRADIIGLASPIAGSDGSVVASIGLSAPASRLHVDEMETFAPRLREFAERISMALGCSLEQWTMLGKGVVSQTVGDVNSVVVSR